MSWRVWVGLGLVVCACSEPVEPLEGDASEVSKAAEVESATDLVEPAELAPEIGASDAPRPEGCALSVALPGDAVTVVDAELPCALTLELAEPRIVEVQAAGATMADEDEPGWLGPRLVEAGSWVIGLEGSGGASVRLRDLGPPPPALDEARSLVWTAAELVEGPGACRLGCVMAEVAPDGHGGPMLEAWFERFATTAHSERLGPTQLLDAYAEALGPDPGAWDLDALPFEVTAVHNRLDLGDGTHCGELRVSLASMDTIHSPFHLIFLFRQPAAAGDLSPGGWAHCTETALKWARLSALDGAAFVQAAREWLGELVTHERFLVAETLEFMVAPWEWRQWFPDAEGLALENRPLFQTVDTPRLNQPGPDRDAFLAWVADNAALLAARQALIPEAFRASSARVNQGVPWVPLDLSGLAQDVRAQWPELRQQIELMGCPGCHTADADFVQTLPDRTFSPFYDKELEARALHLGARAVGAATLAPFGPLQAEPLLTP